MQDIYEFNHEAELQFFDKNLSQIIHTTGKFENLSTTLPDTEAIIRNIPTKGIDPETIEITLGLKHAFEFIRTNSEIDLETILNINNIVKNGTVGAGKIRGESVIVPLTSETWTPPIPDYNQVNKQISSIINNKNHSTTERAIDLNLYLSRWQIFKDGNKRTALVAANNIMLNGNAGFLAIPTDKMHWYGSKLQKYYLSGKADDVKSFLYDNVVQGLPNNRK